MPNRMKLVALAALLVAGPAMAQPQYRPQAPTVTYREGMPDVNAPAPAPIPMPATTPRPQASRAGTPGPGGPPCCCSGTAS
uniref:Uncharacterized protein n=1 Tax=Phenylobacterium glaciei TaxID=2803784 RepID=A0A974P450_9CAUL|nr:hypothetical protein JKL49_06385 [Phenylobacterium glaciei]